MRGIEDKNILLEHSSCYGKSFESLDSKGLFDIHKNKQKEDEKKEVSHESLLKKRFWKIKDTAEFLDCSVGHVYNLSSRGLIPKRKKGKFLVFIPEQIFEWLIQGD